MRVILDYIFQLNGATQTFWNEIACVPEYFSTMPVPPHCGRQRFLQRDNDDFGRSHGDCVSIARLKSMLSSKEASPTASSFASI